jgi:tripartite-type tricarboxylate transporter receptor subunit TctC
MFKHLIVSILALFLSTTSYARGIEVPVIWGFSVASDSGMMIKSIIDSANSNQQKYRFIFTHRPGAAGSVAVNSLLSSSRLSVLAHSSSFYIRPHFHDENYKLEDFTMINTICKDQPIGIISSKYSSVDQFLNQNITMGINPGSIGNLIPRNLVRNNRNLNILEVPYKTTPEATTDVLGGHIDSSVDFLGQVTLSRLTGDTKIIGITGTINHRGMKTFASQGFKGLEDIKVGYYFYVKNDISLDIQKEISDILYQAYNEVTKRHCETDFGSINKIPFENLKSVHSKNINYWRSVSKD